MYSLSARSRVSKSSNTPLPVRLAGSISPGLLLISLLLATGCDSSVLETKPTGHESGQTSSELTLKLPDRIRNTSAIDLNAVQAIAIVNNENVTLNRNGDNFRATVIVAANSQVTIEIRFRETLPNGTVIDLARHPSIRFSTTTTNITRQFNGNDYDTNFDDDNDGISNIAERELNTDPLTPSSLPLTRSLTVSFNLPADILDPQITQVIARFSDATKPVRREGNFFQITGTAPTGSEVDVEVLLVQRLQQFNGNNQPIVFAEANTTVPVGIDNQDIQLTDNDFDTSLDTDGDGKINLQELQQGTNPLVPD